MAQGIMTGIGFLGADAKPLESLYGGAAVLPAFDRTL
jgi:hypothetical protein